MVFLYIFIWPLLLPLVCLWAMWTAGHWDEFRRRAVLATAAILLSAAPDAYIVAANGRSMMNEFPLAGLIGFASAGLIVLAAFGLRSLGRALARRN
jgi:hypothetical protein